MLDVDDELFAIKRAIAHLELGIKAYRAASTDEVDASRLLAPLREEIDKLIDAAQRMRDKIRSTA